MRQVIGVLGIPDYKRIFSDCVPAGTSGVDEPRVFRISSAECDVKAGDIVTKREYVPVLHYKDDGGIAGWFPRYGCRQCCALYVLIFGLSLCRPFEVLASATYRWNEIFLVDKEDQRRVNSVVAHPNDYHSGRYVD